MLNPFFLNRSRALNPYLSINGENYNNSNERAVMNSLQREQIQVFGLGCTYILRTSNTMDEIFGEALGTTFKDSFFIELFPTSTDFLHSNDGIAAFGFNMLDTVNLQGSYDRIMEEFKTLNIPGRPLPIAGDLIYINVSGSLYEIKYIDDKPTQLALGTYSLFTFNCQIFDRSTEMFDTGTSHFDDINNYNQSFELPFMDNQIILDESKTNVIPEPNEWDTMLTESFNG